MTDKLIQKKIYISEDLNANIIKMSKAMNISQSEFFNLAVQQFIEYEKNGQKSNLEDIYTLRMNELIQAVNSMRLEFQNGMESNDNKFNLLIETYNSPTYLNNEE